MGGFVMWDICSIMKLKLCIWMEYVQFESMLKYMHSESFVLV